MLTITGKRLMLARKELHWTQEELAEVSGVSRSQIANIEQGRSTNPSVGSLIALAKVLDLPLAYLAGESSSELHPHEEARIEAESKNMLYIDDHADRKLLQRLIDEFSTLSHQDQQSILRMISALRSIDTPRIIE